MWVFYAILNSFLISAYFFGNQQSKASPTVFMLYRGLVPVIVLLPFLPWVETIMNWQFYVLCMLQGAIIAYVDYRNLRAIRAWGAETVTSIHPFNIGIVFVIWLVLHPSLVWGYLQTPVRLVIVLSALCGVVYAASAYRRSRNSRRALSYMVPYLLMSAVCDALNKQLIDFVSPGQVIFGSYWYILVSAAVVFFINLLMYCSQRLPLAELVDRKNLRSSLVMLPLVLAMVCKNFSMYNTPNPSYVTAIIYTYIVWIMLAGPVLRALGWSVHYPLVDRKRVFLLLLSVIALILAAS